MKAYLLLLIESHLFVVGLLILIHIYEKFSGKLTLINWYRFKKDFKTALGTSYRESLHYFLYNLIFYIVMLKLNKLYSKEINIWVWLIIILILTIIFFKIHFKYQSIDPQKPDWLGLLKNKK